MRTTYFGHRMDGMWNRFRLFAGCLVSTALVALTYTMLLNSTGGEAAESKVTEQVRPFCEDWPEPAFVFFITGRQHGYIEPCGCTGLDSQKGGLARRQTLYRQLEAKGWNIIPIDVGNQVRRFGPQASIKFQTTMAALKDMDYKAVGLGPDDLRIESGELISEIVDETPLVCANTTIAGLPISDGVKIVPVGKHKVGITSVLGEKEQKGIRSTDIQFTKPAVAISQAQSRLQKAGCHVMVLLSHASTEETIELAKSSKAAMDFRIVITAGGADEPALQPELIEGTRSYLIQTGKKGMYVGVLGIFPDAKQRVRYERIPLDKRFKDSPEMLQSLATYQSRLEEIYKNDWTKLVLKPVVHPSGNQFVGSQVCADCHDSAYDIWQQTPHHEATHSIAFPGERSSIPRNFDPECISCHVTGWNAQGFFPYKSGYVDFSKSQHLHGNGCENCHGPGSAHVAAENGDTDLSDEQITQLRETMRLPLAKAQDHCLQCHDLDNDPHFQEDGAFEEYWDQIKHYE